MAFKPVSAASHAVVKAATRRVVERMSDDALEDMLARYIAAKCGPDARAISSLCDDLARAAWRLAHE